MGDNGIKMHQDSRSKPEILEIHLPQYKPRIRPDELSIGEKFDALLYNCQRLKGRDTVVRGIGLQDHDGVTLDEMVEEILTTGTDMNDPSIKPRAYEVIPKQDRGKSFWGKAVKIDKIMDGDIGSLIGEFYESALSKEERGHSVRLDVLMIYDRNKLEMRTGIYPKEESSGTDLFVYKDPEDKIGALLAIVKILR